MAIPVGPTSFTVLAIRPACEMTRFPVQYRLNTFFTDGACPGECFVGEFDRVRSNVFRYIRQADSLIEHFSSPRAKLLEILRIKESVSYGRPLCIK